jgi:hypothetical protein
MAAGSVHDGGRTMNTSVDALLTAVSHLTRSFMAAVAGALATLLWAIYAGTALSWVYATLVLVQFGCYVWYALAAGEAAKALGETRAVYVTWILIAPFAALIPIPVLSTAIGISPLSIKFLLSGQLQSAIRDQTFEVMHPST